MNSIVWRTAVIGAALLAPGPSALAPAQPLEAARLAQPPTDAWPTYNGDYSGRRFSPLTQINKDNVGTLNLAWARRFTSGGGGGITIKATPLMVNGVLYFTAPDHGWAVDALTGREIWHYRYEGGGLHIGNRGFGMYGDWLFFETPDCHIFSLDARTGEERWRQEVADPNQEYFCTPAPLVIGNHVITGVGGDSLDLPGFLEARDPETGEVQWRWNTTPRPGEPGAESWPGLNAMAHGGGMTWISGTYDPELNLYYFGTGNPQPVMAAQNREGDNLYTASLVALNPDTGKLAWYFQASPHDTHDWDNVATPVLIDGEFQGQPRKMVAQVSRNGYYHLLDRVTGESLVTAPFVGALNWASHIDEQGRPIPDPAKEPATDGALVAPSSNGAANWFPPTFSPDTGLFYTVATESWAVFWKTDLSNQAEGWGGRDNTAWTQNLVQAIDYQTGEVRWSHRYPNQGGGRSGLLSTAGGLVFGGDPQGSALAFDAGSGEILWHAGMHASLANGPITYTLEGKQYVVFGAGDMLYAFTLPE